MSGTKISALASSGTSNSSSGQKAPVFSIKKVGFFIPKNKLGGSLVPLLRGDKKPGPSDSLSSAETNKSVPRKTKWGPDLSQDPTVRKARALAYQTRVDQITHQLESGISEIGDAEDTELASQSPSCESYGGGIDSEQAEQLELEKREAIGEILKLNPSYKAPIDYKPVLKEDQVSIPVKQYPGYDFVGLIYGPGGDNQKHLEKETGAKIKIFGTKLGSGNKIEIKQSDSNDINEAYEEIHIYISAETYDKVDAAISVIELLITSVSENLASTTSVPSTPNTSTLDPVHSPTMPVPTRTLTQGQPGYPNHWFPMGLPSAGLGQPQPSIPSAPALNSQPNTPSPYGFNVNSQNPNTISVGPLRNSSSTILAPSMGLTRPPPMIMQPLPPQPAFGPPPGPTSFNNMSQMAPRMVPNLITPSGHPQLLTTFQHPLPRPHGNRPANLMLQSPPPLMPNLSSQSFSHGLTRPPPMGNNMGQQQALHHMSLGPAATPFARNLTRLPSPSSGLPGFLDEMGFSRNYGPTSQGSVFPGPPRPGTHVQVQQFNTSLTFGSGRPLNTPGEQQLYDPFSPTSMSLWRR